MKEFRIEYKVPNAPYVVVQVSPRCSPVCTYLGPTPLKDLVNLGIMVQGLGLGLDLIGVSWLPRLFGEAAHRLGRRKNGLGSAGALFWDSHWGQKS